MENSGVNFVYFDYNQNTTVVLRGSIHIKDNPSGDQDDVTASPTLGGALYDQQGALWYVIVVIFVYSLSMLFLIAMFVKRKGNNKTIDSEVAKFLKGLDGARQRATVERVLRMRLKWPGNFINPRYTGRPEANISATDVEDFPEWPCMASDYPGHCQSEASSDSGSLYTLIPATTVKPEVHAPNRKTTPGCEVVSENDVAGCTPIGTQRILKVDFPEKYHPRTVSGRSLVIKKDEQDSSSEKPKLRAASTTLQLHHLPAGFSHPAAEMKDLRQGVSESGYMSPDRNVVIMDTSKTKPGDNGGQQSSGSGSSSESRPLSDELQLSDIEGVEVRYDTDTET